jgi:hypothetical protein
MKLESTRCTTRLSHGSTVPAEFQPLLRLARTWGIADDVERCEFLESCTLEARRAMVQVVFPHLDSLEKWIALQDHNGSISREVSALRLISQAATEAMMDVYANA